MGLDRKKKLRRGGTGLIGCRALFLLAVGFTVGLSGSHAVAQVLPQQLAVDRSRSHAKFEMTLSGGSTVAHRQRRQVERGFVSTPLPPGLDSVFVDVAELVLTVSTVYDTTEPLLIAAFPATVSPESRSSTWSADWTEMSGGFDPEFVGLASMCSTEDAVEIRLDVTAFVRRWVAGEAPNYGVVLKTLSEGGKSTSRWIRDGRYDGGDARLEIRYSRL